ncbi:ABC transporter ATP-binding protein [Enemella evansiae]|uniref:ABC transporter ATP-binding protein n=1 Tax=Enemella evansiae TaxID=2016499 RepID=UPI0010E5B8B6|nr:ABC transporter ATP-binding protein [Enemella evansiae]TDO93615.1 putative ABC transport system ATP-binding protein [Enemella evansiae]
MSVIAPPTAAAVRTEGLTRRYGEGEAAVTALDRVTIDIANGEFTAIMGPSGSGKSTLMHCAAGLDSATAGRAWIGTTEITGLSDKKLTELRRDRVGFIFQAFNLLPTLNARENVLLPLQLAGRRPDQAWFDEIVGVLGIANRLSHRPGELSGGQQQRVAVARALVTKPKVIFADEPTGALDSRSSTELLGFLRESVDRLGQSVVMVTHDPRAAGYCDRILRLSDGRVVADESGVR